MTLQTILKALDDEIARLESAREILVHEPLIQSERSHQPRAGKRNISPAGRKRISDAVKRRWELHRAAKA